MVVYISSLNEKIQVDDEYLPDNVGMLDDTDIALILDEEEEQENWEGD